MCETLGFIPAPKKKKKKKKKEQEKAENKRKKKEEEKRNKKNHLFSQIPPRIIHASQPCWAPGHSRAQCEKPPCPEATCPGWRVTVLSPKFMGKS
jgi:hypothetical protein